MKYYKVKPMFDNVAKIKATAAGKVYHTGDIYIGNELYTEKEVDKMKNSFLLPASIDKMFDVVTINKNHTFFCFGARFEMEG